MWALVSIIITRLVLQVERRAKTGNHITVPGIDIQDQELIKLQPMRSG